MVTGKIIQWLRALAVWSFGGCLFVCLFSDNLSSIVGILVLGLQGVQCLPLASMGICMHVQIHNGSHTLQKWVLNRIKHAKYSLLTVFNAYYGFGLAFFCQESKLQKLKYIPLKYVIWNEMSLLIVCSYNCTTYINCDI